MPAEYSCRIFGFLQFPPATHPISIALFTSLVIALAVPGWVFSFLETHSYSWNTLLYSWRNWIHIDLNTIICLFYKLCLSDYSDCLKSLFSWKVKERKADLSTLSLDIYETTKEDTLSHCLYVGFKTILGFVYIRKRYASLWLYRDTFSLSFLCLKKWSLNIIYAEYLPSYLVHPFQTHRQSKVT